VSRGRGCEAQKALLSPTCVWPRQGRGGKGRAAGSAKVYHLAPNTVAMISALAWPPEYLDQTQYPEFANAVYNTFQFLKVLHARVTLFRRADVLRARKFSLGGKVECGLRLRHFRWSSSPTESFFFTLHVVEVEGSLMPLLRNIHHMLRGITQTI
jgi:hypothetical protein